MLFPTYASVFKPVLAKRVVAGGVRAATGCCFRYWCCRYWCCRYFSLVLLLLRTFTFTAPHPSIISRGKTCKFVPGGKESRLAWPTSSLLPTCPGFPPPPVGGEQHTRAGVEKEGKETNDRQIPVDSERDRKRHIHEGVPSRAHHAKQHNTTRAILANVSGYECWGGRSNPGTCSGNISARFPHIECTGRGGANSSKNTMRWGI